MERDEFREAVFARDNHKCVACGFPAVDADPDSQVTCKSLTFLLYYLVGYKLAQSILKRWDYFDQW